MSGYRDWQPLIIILPNYIADFIHRFYSQINSEKTFLKTINFKLKSFEDWNIIRSFANIKQRAICPN